MSGRQVKASREISIRAKREQRQFDREVDVLKSLLEHARELDAIVRRRRARRVRAYLALVALALTGAALLRAVIL